MSHDLMNYLMDRLHPLTRKCLIHHEIIMERKIFDQDLFMYEYYCKECNIWYSSRLLDIMELEQ